MEKFKSHFFIALLICVFTTSQSFAKSTTNTVEQFSKRTQFYNAKISPDGKHLATITNHEGEKNLVFFKTDTLEIVYVLRAGKDSQAGQFYWANNERVVVQIEQMRGALEAPVSLGEIYAINFDGRKPKMLFGYRSKPGIVLAADGGFLLDLLPDDPKNILIVKQPLTRKTDVIPRVVKLNIYTGKARNSKSAPMPYSRLLTDNNGAPRFAASVDNNFNSKLFYSAGKKDKWRPFLQDLKGEFSPLSFSSDNESVFGLLSSDGKPAKLVKLDLEQQKFETVHQSARVEATHILKSSLNNVYGVRLDEDYPSYVYFDESSPSAKLHKALFNAFKYQKLEITSQTQDGKKMIIRVSGDTNPGSFYLFDAEKMDAKPLFQAASWIDTKQLAQMVPIRLEAKDGLEINGFLTLPKGKEKNLPLVVMPHGGPHARDYWGYDPTVQMLANAGYAVVQVNFRGSTGYGDSFVEAGYGQWGEAIQQDIQLATQYAIESGVADKNRVCIFGASFGGYSALQSSIMFPDLYKCAIGYVGVYDLPMLYNEGDIKSIKWGDAYLDETLGRDVEVQKQHSPTYNLDNLNAPVFFIHVQEVLRAPIDHAEKLRAGLDKINHPYEWLVKDKEGHGFYNEDNVLEANNRILSFLEKHIGE